MRYLVMVGCTHDPVCEVSAQHRLFASKQATPPLRCVAQDQAVVAVVVERDPLDP